ncbi:MAG: hypothetical protein IPP74_09330 [Alphaproteobacteria bacterium]|nr:hypothetical protein [Alphaproteobacteria bacterium]
MFGRISSAGYVRQALNDITATRETLVDLQRDISTGKQAQTYDQLSSQGKLERVTYLETALTQNDTYTRNTTIIKARVTQMSSEVDNLQNLASDLRQLIVSARNPVEGQVLPIKQLVFEKLQLIADALNSSMEGRHLFAGSKTNIVPVVVDENGTNINDDGTPNNSYYRGNDTILKADVDNGVSMPYNVTADNPAFQSLIAAAYKAMEVGDSGAVNASQRDVLLVQSLDLINQSISQLQNVSSSVNSNLVVLQDLVDKHTDDGLFTISLLSDETDTDIVNTSIKESSYETVLQASFQVFARLSKLTLSDYL